MAKGKWILQTGAVLLACLAVPIGMIYRLRQQEQHERGLFAAIVRGDAGQVQAELDWGVSPNTRQPPDAPTDLREYIERLFRRQSLPNRQQDAPALLSAERHGQQKAARILLLAGADPNATDSTGTQPLMLALIGPEDHKGFPVTDAKTALLMLEKGADPNTHDYRDTVLQLALSFRKWDIARQLILRGANVNVRNERGDSLLLCADSDLYLTGLMLSRGANVNAANESGYTALMGIDENLTPLLLTRGANVHAKTSSGETALQVAAAGHETEKIRWLLRYGADCNSVHNNGWNLLCWSAAHGQLELASMALARGIGVNTRNGFSRTPLMFAASKGDSAMVRWLLRQGANVNAQDKAGMTALMYAVQEDKALAVQLLLQHGANLRLRDRERKWTAIGYAQHFCAENAIALFRTGKALPPLPSDTNPNGDSKRSCVRVDTNRWLVRTPIARKDDPRSAANEYVHAFAVRLADDSGRQGTSIVVHQVSQLPSMLAFRDGDGRRYVYVEEREDIHPGGAIYLVKGLQLVRTWDGVNRFGMDCVLLPHGGALVRRYAPGHYEYHWGSPRERDGLIEISRFHNGVMKELGTMDTPGE